jgi:hypothetical protein
MQRGPDAADREGQNKGVRRGEGACQGGTGLVHTASGPDALTVAGVA